MRPHTQVRRKLVNPVFPLRDTLRIPRVGHSDAYLQWQQRQGGREFQASPSWRAALSSVIATVLCTVFVQLWSPGICILSVVGVKLQLRPLSRHVAVFLLCPPQSFHNHCGKAHTHLRESHTSTPSFWVLSLSVSTPCPRRWVFCISVQMKSPAGCDIFESWGLDSSETGSLHPSF